MALGLDEVAWRWATLAGVDPADLPGPCRCVPRSDSTRAPAGPSALDSWERRHGFDLPRALRAWLSVSDGLYGPSGPLVHPLAAIGPMVPFARMPGMVVQPESWFELGNPNVETVCIDLSYRWGEGGDCPIFTSGDDQAATRPRVIAPGFAAWMLRLLGEGCREFWFDPGYRHLGDPWREHTRRAPPPALPARLAPFASRVRPLMRPDADDRSIAAALGISRLDVEALFRHLQHAPHGPGEVALRP